MHHSLIPEKSPAFDGDRAAVLALLKAERRKFDCLSGRRRLMAWAAVRMPGLYRAVYRFYVKHLQVNVYE